MYEKAEMQKRVREMFWALSMGGQDTHAVPGTEELEQAVWKQEEEDLVVVDAGGEIEAVAEAIWSKVRPRVEQVDRGEVGKTVRVVR